jgi:hypothetical protein
MEDVARSDLLLDLVKNVEEYQAQLTDVMHSYPIAYHTSLKAAQELKDVEQEMKDYLNAHVLGLEFQAKAGEGPLVGLAKTSAAYKTAIDVAKATCSDGEISDMRDDVVYARNRVMQAEVDLHSEKTQFAALRSMLDATSSLLRALAR